MAEPDLLPAAEYAVEQRAMRDCAVCTRFILIRRQLGDFPHGVISREHRDRITAALDEPEKLHELLVHPRFASHQLAIVRERQAVLRLVEQR